MNCIVTAGPTYEKMDNVRRLTNFSTGRLGTELANYLTARGHDVTLLIGEQATFAGPRQVNRVETFTTTTDLRDWLQAQAGAKVGAIFHAAAVSDFMFGKIWLRPAQGEMTEVKSGKISTRQGTLLAELVPTPKILSGLRDWFPQTQIVGWKYEVDGDRATVIAASARQLHECLTDACVANGAAYGEGFGLVTPNGKCVHLADAAALFETLEASILR
ncbi:MAG: DNA/pantothenate metabolism flavoprotein domain protein [Akkermansiaceae bacterium]|nr:DNA/pantothenate metabolism flavoprotein domain protein [Verrucomicrobiales bacterium]